MGDRTVPFDPKAVCDVCGKAGAYDFIGDLICADCAAVNPDEHVDPPEKPHD
jgi:hypothetical protein